MKDQLQDLSVGSSISSSFSHLNCEYCSQGLANKSFKYEDWSCNGCQSRYIPFSSIRISCNSQSHQFNLCELCVYKKRPSLNGTVKNQNNSQNKFYIQSSYQTSDMRQLKTSPIKTQIYSHQNSINSPTTPRDNAPPQRYTQIVTTKRVNTDNPSQGYSYSKLPKYSKDLLGQMDTSVENRTYGSIATQNTTVTNVNSNQYTNANYINNQTTSNNKIPSLTKIITSVSSESENSSNHNANYISPSNTYRQYNSNNNQNNGENKQLSINTNLPSSRGGTYYQTAYTSPNKLGKPDIQSSLDKQATYQYSSTGNSNNNNNDKMESYASNSVSLKQQGIQYGSQKQHQSESEYYQQHSVSNREMIQKYKNSPKGKTIGGDGAGKFLYNNNNTTTKVITTTIRSNNPNKKSKSPKDKNPGSTQYYNSSNPYKYQYSQQSASSSPSKQQYYSSNNKNNYYYSSSAQGSNNKYQNYQHNDKQLDTIQETEKEKIKRLQEEKKKSIKDVMNSIREARKSSIQHRLQRSTFQALTCEDQQINYVSYDNNCKYCKQQMNNTNEQEAWRCAICNLENSGLRQTHRIVCDTHRDYQICLSCKVLTVQANQFTKVLHEKVGFLPIEEKERFYCSNKDCKEVLTNIWQQPTEDKWECKHCRVTNSPYLLRLRCPKHDQDNMCAECSFKFIEIFEIASNESPLEKKMNNYTLNSHQKDNGNSKQFSQLSISARNAQEFEKMTGLNEEEQQMQHSHSSKQLQLFPVMSDKDWDSIDNHIAEQAY